MWIYATMSYVMLWDDMMYYDMNMYRNEEFYDAQFLGYDLKFMLGMKWFIKAYGCILPRVIYE